MAEQIAHRDPLGREGVLQPEFREVIPHRLLPIEAPLVHQKGQARGGERLDLDKHCYLSERTILMIAQVGSAQCRMPMPPARRP
jgi:hypothetical protein